VDVWIAQLALAVAARRQVRVAYAPGLVMRYPTLTALRNAGRVRITKVIKARSPRRLASYASLAPVTRQPGKPVTGEFQSRRGNHRLNVILAMLTMRQPCQPVRSTCRREIADAA
jgi:hypothetical protein